MKLIDNYIKEHYDAYDDRVKVLLSRTFEDCKKNNEKLSNYFYTCLDLLAHQASLYYMAWDAIEMEKKVSSEDAYRRRAKNPAIMVLNNAHKEILNILKNLSLSPFDIAKLKRLNKDSGEDESAEDLLNALVG